MPAHRPTDEYQQPPDDALPHQQARIIVPAEVLIESIGLHALALTHARDTQAG